MRSAEGFPRAQALLRPGDSHMAIRSISHATAESSESGCRSLESWARRFGSRFLVLHAAVDVPTLSGALGGRLGYSSSTYHVDVSTMSVRGNAPPDHPEARSRAGAKARAPTCAGVWAGYLHTGGVACGGAGPTPDAPSSE
jgi:hypothetical protein